MAAATFTQLVTIAGDGDFQGRVRIAFLETAIAVYNEAPATAGHVGRANFATRVLRNEAVDPQTAALMVVTSSAIQAAANPATTPDFAITDQNILDQVSSAWNAMAGV